MHPALRAHARDYILKYLGVLPEDCGTAFRLLYGRKNGKRTVFAAMVLTAQEVVQEVPDEKLEWAMTQVDNSMEKMKKGLLT